MSKATSIKRRSHWPISILSTISAAVNMLLPIVLVRLMTPEEIGIFKVFFLYLIIVPAFAFTSGVFSGLAYWAGQENKFKAVQASSLLVLISATVFFVGALLLQNVLGLILPWPSIYIFIFAFALFGAIAGHFFEEAAISSGRIWTGAIFYAGFEISRTLIILLVAYLYRDLALVFLTHTAFMLFKVCIGYIYGYKLNLVRLSLPDKETLKGVWGYAFPVSLAWMFGIFVSYADQFILSMHISSAEFAFYAIGCLIIPPLLILEHSITRVLIPQLSEAFARGENAAASKLYKEAVEGLALLLIPAVAGLIVFAKPIIELLFTSTYSSAADYLQIFAFTYLLLIFPFDAVPRAKGQAKWILKTFMKFSALSLGLVFTLTYFFGPFGALSGILLSKSFLRLYAMFHVRDVTSWEFADFLPARPILMFTLASVIVSASALLVRPMFPNDGWWLALYGPFFALLYFMFLLVIRGAMEKDKRLPSKALILTQSLHVGGLERMVLSLCLKMKELQGESPMVYAYNHNETHREDKTTARASSLLDEFKKNGIPVEAFAKSSGFSLKVVVRLFLYVYKNKINLIHSQDLGGLIYASCIKMLSLGRIRVVHTQHSFIHLDARRRYVIYEKIFTRFANLVTVVSEDMKSTYLRLGFSEEGIFLIENGVDFPDKPVADRSEKLFTRKYLAESIDDPQQKKYLTDHIRDNWIVHLARLHPRKGQSHAIELWNRLSPLARKQSVLLLVGPEYQGGEREKLSNLISGATDKNRIFILGGSSEPEKWHRASDIYLACSEYEGMPLGALEALGAGLPALLSKIKGHELFAGVASQYNLEDVEEGAQKLENLIQSSSQADAAYFQKFWAASQWLRDRYSTTRMARKYLALYEGRLKPLVPVYKEGYTRGEYG